MQQWFALLLHSSLVKTLAGNYSDFGALAGAALDIVAARQGVTLTEQGRQGILATVRQLPPHPDVVENLERLRAAGLRLATLTNSSPEMLAAQMNNSGLTDYFEMLLSVDEVKRFKPAAETYRMAAEKLGVAIGDTRLVAAHDWDVFGALRAGCAGAFSARGVRLYHPLYDAPDVNGPDLSSVADQILARDT